MSLTIPRRAPGIGRHRSASPAELGAEIRRLTTALAEAERANHAMAHDLTQAGLTIADQRERLHAADKLLKSWAGKVVRAEAEQRRLRQAVINARPRITVAENHARVAPYSPEVLHVSDVDSSLHLEFATYPVPKPPADPFRYLDGRGDPTTSWTPTLIPLPAAGHQPHCQLATYGTPADCCTCQPPL